MTEEYSNLPGTNTLLMGPAGTGKTFSTGSLADAGVECFFLALESGMESFTGYWTDRGKPVPDNVHWHRLGSQGAGLAELRAQAETINKLTFELLSKSVDPNKKKYDQFLKLLSALNDFRDDRTGKHYGAVDTWGMDKVLIVDGLTGLSNCAMNLVVGGKPVRSLPDWGIAQNQVENLIRLLCDSCRCHFVLLSHVERESDLVLGGQKISPMTLGRALPAKLPPMFSDVILSERDKTTYTWNTINPQADVKSRNLAISERITPDFGQIIKKWTSRGGKLVDKLIDQEEKIVEG